jgi:hypothetical protein
LKKLGIFKKHFQKKFVILDCCKPENFGTNVLRLPYDDGEGGIRTHDGYTVTLINKKYSH